MTDINNTLHLGGVELPHADQYAGIWAMHPEAITAATDRLNGLGLADHVALSRAVHTPSARYASGAYPVIGDGTAVLQLLGPITKHGSSLRGTSSVSLRRQVRHAAEDDRVRSILLIVDSPGGTVAGSHDLAADVAAAAKKKPVTAFVEDLGASAAYLIACQARTVFATKTTMVGSIGTYAVIVDSSKMADKIGLKVHVVKTGAFKGAGTPGTEVTAEQLAEWQRVVDQMNDRFIEAVARGRHMSIDKVKQFADGRVHVGHDAVTLGLIDGIKTFDEVVDLVGQNSHAHKELEMSRTNDTKTPATIGQLKEAFPRASADFYVKQIEASATIEQAQSAFIEAQQDEIAGLKAKAKAGGIPVGSLPAGRVASGHCGGDAEGHLKDLVAEKVAAGMPQHKAFAAVCRENPDLREDYVLEHNAARGRV